MHCKNCSAPLAPGASYCASCGAHVEQQKRYCQNCGYELAATDYNCPGCGLSQAQAQGGGAQPFAPNGPKSRMAAGLLGIFLGSLGIHNFYLGFTNRAITQLILGTVGGFFTCGIASAAVAIWGLVEGIMVLTGSIAADAQGVPLRD